MLVKIYTKTGDDGTTGVLGERRLSKDDPRIDAYGTVDELNAALGFARALGLPDAVEPVVARIQDELFIVGAALADLSVQGRFRAALTDRHIGWLERTIDGFEAGLDPLAQFILPGGSPAAAQLHLARTVCRRAERLVVELGRRPAEEVPNVILVYLNRLSDLLFVLAREVNRRAGLADVPWKGLS